MKKTQVINITLILALILSLSVFLVPKRTGAQATGCLILTRSLNIGFKDNSSKDVSALQNFLYSKGYLSVNPTGYFGNLTLNAVKKFQTAEGVSPVGNVGPITRARISKITCVPVVENPAPTPTPIPTPVEPTTPIQTSKTLPFEFSNISDFNISWGNVTSILGGALDVKASTTTNGAQIILGNTGNWTDYKISTNVFVKQSTVTLIARYLDDNNFLGCTFNGKYIEIVQKISGNSQVVASTIIEHFPGSSFFYQDLNLSMRVKGKTVGCSLVGSEDNVTFTNVDGKLIKGGVGLQTWVNAVNVANVEMRKFKVEAI